MSDLEMLKDLVAEKTSPQPAAKAAKSPYDSNDSSPSRQFLESGPHSETDAEDQNNSTQVTAKTAKTPFGSNDSTQVERCSKSGIAQDTDRELAALMENDAGLTTPQTDDLCALEEAFHGHLFGPGKSNNCCYAPRQRYCPTGQELHDRYHAALGKGKHTKGP